MAYEELIKEMATELTTYKYLHEQTAVKAMQRIEALAEENEELKKKLDWLPQHEAGLCISHNDHKSNYETVLYLSERDDGKDWVSNEEWGKAIETNEMWTIQWYPNTPVVYKIIHASSLEALEKYLNDQ